MGAACETVERSDERTRVALRHAELRAKATEGDDPLALERLRALFSHDERRAAPRAPRALRALSDAVDVSATPPPE